MFITIKELPGGHQLPLTSLQACSTQTFLSALSQWSKAQSNQIVSLFTPSSPPPGMASYCYTKVKPSLWVAHLDSIDLTPEYHSNLLSGLSLSLCYLDTLVIVHPFNPTSPLLKHLLFHDNLTSILLLKLPVGLKDSAQVLSREGFTSLWSQVL